MKGKGQVGAVNAVIMLVVGAAVASMVLMLTSVMSGQAYSITEPQITAITNATIESKVRQAAVSGFDAQVQTGQYLPLIVLAIVIFIVLSLVTGFARFGGGGGGAL